jgi:endonuclease/exonuclease/phosphatase (EEP) superfamily protein YafD
MWNARRSTHRAGLAALIGILALVLSQLAGMGAASPAGARGTTPVATPVRIATLNTAAMSSTGEAMADIRALLAQEPDIVALQEMSSWERRRRVIDRLICGENGVDGGLAEPTPCAYAGWVPIPAVQGGTPILWRKDKFTLLGHDWVQVTPKTFVGDRGAGPRVMNAKYVVRVRLRDVATGRQIWVLNNHFVPTVQAARGGRNDNTRRTALYARHMAALKTMVTDLRRRGLTFITGDFNVNYRTDKVVQDPIFPYAGLGSVGARSSYYELGEPATGTHRLRNGFDKRLIDYVHHRVAPRRVVPVGQRILKGYNSDHRPLVVDYKVLGRGCYQAGTIVC